MLILIFCFLFLNVWYCAKLTPREKMEVYGWQGVCYGWPNGSRHHPITERSRAGWQKKPQSVHQQPRIMSNGPWGRPWTPLGSLSSSSWMVNTMVSPVYYSNGDNKKKEGSESKKKKSFHLGVLCVKAVKNEQKSLKKFAAFMLECRKSNVIKRTQKRSPGVQTEVVYILSLKTYLASYERRLSASTASNMAECAGNKFLMSLLERLKALWC